MGNLLSVVDHSRDSVALTYVYPVVSRRAGGVSIGINLNPNNACNWRCVYCQVPDLQRGNGPEIDLALLERELRSLLSDVLLGDFMLQRVPEDARRLNDIALSGNGEPSTCRQFAEVIAVIGRVMADFALCGKIRLVMISNGSQIHRPEVLAGLERMAQLGGEVWYKLDRAPVAGFSAVNQVALSEKRLLTNLALACERCPCWIQTCMFALDGQPPTEGEVQAYLAVLAQAAELPRPPAGVLLYGLARASTQPEAVRLSALPEHWMQQLAARIEAGGLAVRLSV